MGTIKDRNRMDLKENESESHSVMSDSFQTHELYSPWHSPGKNTGVDNRPLLQGIFPTQGLNPGVPHCRWILYQLSHQGRSRILEWVAYPFSSGSSQPRNQTGVSYIAGWFFTSWATRLLGPHPYLPGLMKATIISSIGTHDCGLNEMTSLMCLHKSLLHRYQINVT